MMAGLVAGLVSVAPAMAAHNNPWAGQDDTVLARNHDENQAQSIGKPGEDQMRGITAQSANGRIGGGLGGAAPADGTGHAGGNGHGGAGGGGQGGGRN